MVLENLLYRAAAVLTAGNLFLTGCVPAYEVSAKFVPEGSYASSEAIKTRFTDPIIRAAGIKLFNNLISGTASLVEKDGDFYLYTIAHLIEKAGDRPLNITFQDKDSTPSFYGAIRPWDFKYHPRTNRGEDVAVSFRLNGEVGQYFKGIVEQGLMIPLTISNSKELSSGKILAVPVFETGEVTFLKTDGKDNFGRISLWHDFGESICDGRSGSPILEMEGGIVTNRVIGLMSQGDSSYLVIDQRNGNRLCYIRSFATPIN